MKRIFVLLLLTITLQGVAQVKSAKLTAAEIPKSIKFNGKYVKGFRFTDAGGEHLMLATEAGETQSTTMNDGDYREAALYAYQFNQKGGEWIKAWSVQDFVKECPVDIEAAFLKDALSVTDLDKNGKAEVWIMYKTACRGDVSPSDLKIIMYEDGKKYAMRGLALIKLPGTEPDGGSYTFDQSFKNGTKVFKQYAEKLWNKYKLETFK